MVARARVGISGTGFVGRQLLRALVRSEDLSPAAVLTRRETLPDYPAPELLTRDPDRFLRGLDAVVECTGDPRAAAELVTAAFGRRLPVVTMNTEFHVTCGSALVDQGWLSEAEGDQPGCLAALARDARAMGFSPLVYGNLKGFLDPDPSPEAMAHWAERLGFTRIQVTSFTDGTKLQFEQALVANGLGATIIQRGLAGLEGPDRLALSRELGRLALATGGPVADYLLHGSHPPGVFLAALHDDAETDALRGYKMGPGPIYYLERPFHLCALEIPKTVREALRGEPPLLNNGRMPTVSMAAVAKRELKAGQSIPRGIGSFEVRGEAVLWKEAPEHVPLGLLFDAVLVRDVPAGATLAWGDVALPDSLALRLARSLGPCPTVP